MVSTVNAACYGEACMLCSMGMDKDSRENKRKLHQSNFDSNHPILSLNSEEFDSIEHLAE